MAEHSVFPEPAATLILLQDSVDGPQVLMQQRHPGAAFVGGAWVFPGGKLEAADYADGWLKHVDISAVRANRLLGMDCAALAYWIAAVRETVEEAGLLLANQNNQPVTPVMAAEIQRSLLQNQSGFLTLCEQYELTLPTDTIRYLSRWVTPPGLPRRYDTRFFLTRAPASQQPEQDPHEVVNTCWITPRQALRNMQEQRWSMVLPTIATLQQLSGYDTVDTLLHRLGNHIDAKSG